MAKYPEFKVPDSYIVPEGVAEGESFEDICTIQLKADGQLCLIKLGDSPIYDEGDSKKDDAEPEDFGTAQGLENRLTTAYRNRGT